jgi:hypothetical protein
MFLVLLVASLVLAAVHLTRTGGWETRRAGELTLLYILVGYCGLPMLGVGFFAALAPERAAAVLGFAAGNPFQAFLTWAYLGMALAATLSLRYRGVYLVAPAVLWATFFAGATQIHLAELHTGGALTHGGFVGVFVTHGLVSLLLLGALIASGLLRTGRSE